MKGTIITKAVVRNIDAELFQPFTISSGSHKSLENVCLGIRTKEGVWGWGEAAIAPHITGETRARTLGNLKKTAAWLEGRDIADYFGAMTGLEDRLEDNRCALAAAGMALLDAASRSLKIPLWRLYGSRPSRLKTDITVVIGTAAQAGDFAAGMRARGFSVFKIKTGSDMDEDFRRVAAVRKAAPKAGIYLDFNGAFTARSAERFVKELEKKGIVPDMVEQPVPKNDHEGLGYLSRRLKVPVCADESAYSVHDAVSLIRKRQATAINIKLAKLGMLRAREVWALARAAGVKLMIGQMLETELSSACAAHFASGLGGFDFIDLDSPFLIKRSVMRGGRYISGSGAYDIPAVRAGIGYAPGIS